MATHNEIGKEGENLAADWLSKQEYQLLKRNFRFKYWEIDIIAEKNQILHFIEVKTRSSEKFGLPEDSVTTKKMKQLKIAAAVYLRANPQYKWIQFDIISVIIQTAGRNKTISISLIEDVYF
jgi:putative endonuclease